MTVIGSVYFGFALVSRSPRHFRRLRREYSGAVTHSCAAGPPACQPGARISGIYEGGPSSYADREAGAHPPRKAPSRLPTCWSCCEDRR